MTTIAEARDRLIADTPVLTAFGDSIADAIRSATNKLSVSCKVSARVKAPASFVGKCLRKSYPDPWTDVTDKVGVRVTVENIADIARIETVVAEHPALEVVERQDKTQELWEQRKIGYLGLHLQVKGLSSDSVGMACEIQVRTAAQNLWSEMDHKLVYKPSHEPDSDTKRALHRLAALMEIFDEEVNRRMSQIVAAPGYAVEPLIDACVRHFFMFSASEFDRSLSRFVLIELGAALPDSADLPAYVERLSVFVSKHKDKLQRIYTRYETVKEAPSLLIHQPESILIFERLDSASMLFEEEWPETLPMYEYDTLKAIWGT